jgi:hypothetical protein
MHSQNINENGWGFYIDTESLKSSFPNNEYLLRQKYNVKIYDNYYDIDEEYEYFDEESQIIERKCTKCTIKTKYLHCLILYSFIVTVIVYTTLHCHYSIPV